MTREEIMKGIRKTIRKVLSNYCDGTWNGLGEATFVEYSEGHNLPQECAEEMECEILSYLSKSSVMLKVDRELPSFRLAVNKSYNDYMLGQEDMLKAGYVAVEPLIKEDM